jgi:hypothetical protein
MKVLHFPVGGRTLGGKHRDGLPQPASRRSGHVLEDRHRAAREPGKSGFSCPGCGATTADSELIRIGYCGTCLRPTGLCPVGRDISLSGIALDMGELCSAFGVALWDFDGVGRRLVCHLHDLELADRRYVWIRGTRVGP